VGVFIFFNDILLGGMTQSFRRGIRHSEAAVELLEVESVCGKLNGNGNGMNYFGAALVTAVSTEEMDNLVAELEGDFDTVAYTVLEDNQIDVPELQHRRLTFDDTVLQEGATYYCIYFYVHEHPASNIFDIRGY
jgi:hypothetical protein